MPDTTQERAPVRFCSRSLLRTTAAAVFTVGTLCTLVTPRAHAADKGPMWTARYKGPGSASLSNYYDYAESVTTDSRGNSYVGGLIVEAAGDSMAVVKYDPNGIVLWRTAIPSAYNRTHVAVDAQGNVYAAGSVSAGGTLYRMTVVKLNPSGQILWSRNSANTIVENLTGIALDPSGNAYVCGFATVSSTVTNFVTIKWDSAGNLIWNKNYSAPGNKMNLPRGLAFGGSTVFVTGQSYDDDQDASHWTTIAYRVSDGTLLWQSAYTNTTAGADIAYAIRCDSTGTPVITGTSLVTGSGYHYTTIKYNPTSGAALWTAIYPGLTHPDDVASDLAIDTQNAVYVTGSAAGTTAADIVTVKYNASGVQQWVARQHGTGTSGDHAAAIQVDAQGNTVIAGSILTGMTEGVDLLTLKYNASGTLLWQATYKGIADLSPITDIPVGVALDPQGNAIIIGTTVGINNTVYDWITLKYPASGYAARKIAVGGDNKPRLLWNRTSDGAATVWQLPTTGGPAAEIGVNEIAPTGYEPQSFAVGPTDNKVRLLWVGTGVAYGNRTAVWTLNTALTGIESGYTFYAPSVSGTQNYYPASDLAVASDNLIRLLWQKGSADATDTSALVYNLTATGTIGAKHVFAPAAGYTFLTTLALGPIDKEPRLVQTKGGTDNTISYGTVKSDLSGFAAGTLYHPAGYAFVASAIGGDGKARLLWEKTDTSAFVIWQVGMTGTIEKSVAYGPLSNYTARSIAVGSADNKIRLLWTGLDGKAAVWTLKADLTGIENAYTYGPYN